jgi:hypothetical protein
MIDSLPALNTRQALADALAEPARWKHRKVDSLRLMEGQLGRRRVSLDCTPPPEPALAYEADERDKLEISDVRGSVMVPLTLLRKGALKSFDLSGPDGNSMPVLGRSENAWLATGVLAHEIVGLSEPEPEIVTAIRRIVESAPDAAKDVAAELLMGRYKGKTLLNSDDLTDTARLLIQELAECFLLIALLPSELAGKRGVIKYSFHWRPVPSRGLNWGTRLLAAGGYCGAIHQIELGRPSDAASYHLEVHAPIGLICGNLKLPTTANENNDSPPIIRGTAYKHGGSRSWCIRICA